MAARRLATKFARLLRNKKLTCRDVAEGTGYALISVRSWYGGFRHPSPHAVQIVAGFLRMRAKDLAEMFDRVA